MSEAEVRDTQRKMGCDIINNYNYDKFPRVVSSSSPSTCSPLAPRGPTTSRRRPVRACRSAWPITARLPWRQAPPPRRMNTSSSTACRSVLMKCLSLILLCLFVTLHSVCFPSSDGRPLLQRQRHHPDSHLGPRLLRPSQPIAAGCGDRWAEPGRPPRSHKSPGGLRERRHWNSGASDRQLHWQGTNVWSFRRDGLPAAAQYTCFYFEKLCIQNIQFSLFYWSIIVPSLFFFSCWHERW